MDVKLGTGRATGMFYHAPAGTALPTSLATTLPEAWVHVGDVSDTGITLAFNKSVTNLKNWANVIKRAIQTDHSETIQSPIMDTTADTACAMIVARPTPTTPIPKLITNTKSRTTLMILLRIRK